MKNLSKLIISVCAVAVASATMALSAMADETIKGTYDPKTGVVTLDPFESTGDQQTLLVLTEDAETVTADKIAQVDQDDSITSFVLDEGLTEGTYYIRIGGTNGTIRTGTLVISGSGDYDTEEITIGDADLNGAINASDVGYILRFSNGYTDRIKFAGTTRENVNGEEVIIGDADLNATINASDVGYVLRCSNGFTDRIKEAGKKIEVKVVGN